MKIFKWLFKKEPDKLVRDDAVSTAHDKYRSTNKVYKNPPRPIVPGAWKAYVVKEKIAREKTAADIYNKAFCNYLRRNTMTAHHIKDKRPKDKTYVLCRYTGGNWSDPDDQNGCVWKVMQFRRGISEKERGALPEDDERKSIITGADEYGNNLKPYYWKSFGASSFFGQDVDYWTEVPEVEPLEKKERGLWPGFKAWYGDSYNE